jgi:hypothetical protein
MTVSTPLLREACRDVLCPQDTVRPQLERKNVALLSDARTLTPNVKECSRKLAALRVHTNMSSGTYNWQHAWPTCGSRPMLFRGEHRWALIRGIIKLGLTVGLWYLHEECDLLGCKAVQFGRSPPTIQGNVSPPYSGSKSTQSNKPGRSGRQA